MLREAAERFGRIVFARAYADWQDPSHSGDPASLFAAGLEPVYVLAKRCPPGGSGDVRLKGPVGVKLAADCIEASHILPNVETYVIVTGDDEFIHVVNNLRARGKQVVVIGASWTAVGKFTEAADVVLYYDIDVERLLEQEPDRAGASPQPVRPPATAATKSPLPMVVQSAESAVAHLATEGTVEPDQRKVAEVLEVIMGIVQEFRRDRRDLSVSALGQELRKRLPAADFALHARGRTRPYAQALAAHRQIKLVPRGFVDWIYLPNEPDELMAASSATEPRHQAHGGLAFSDLTPDQQRRVIQAIRNEESRTGAGYLTFNRVRELANPIVPRDEFAVRNLVNSMIDLGILRYGEDRFGRDPGSGATYSFRTFQLDPRHRDVARVLGPAA